MHCQQGGELWACFGLLDAFRRFSGGFEPFLGSVAHRSNQLGSPVWPVRVVVLCTYWAPIWPVVATSLTGRSWADAAALFSSSRWHAFVQGELHWFRGSFLWFSSFDWWFALFAWALFCLRCVEPLPLPKRSETCLLQVILLFAFLWLLIACWSFFLFVLFLFLFSHVTICVCCQCTHQGGDWGPCVVRGPVVGRFLVWWVIDNIVWTDSWLSIVGAGCGSTDVGAGEEQARKVIAGEASRCGEDK
jgi:hypothetical protein